MKGSSVPDPISLGLMKRSMADSTIDPKIKRTIAVTMLAFVTKYSAVIAITVKAPNGIMLSNPVIKPSNAKREMPATA